MAFELAQRSLEPTSPMLLDIGARWSTFLYEIGEAQQALDLACRTYQTAVRHLGPNLGGCNLQGEDKDKASHLINVFEGYITQWKHGEYFKDIVVMYGVGRRLTQRRY